MNHNDYYKTALTDLKVLKTLYSVSNTAAYKGMLEGIIGEAQKELDILNESPMHKFLESYVRRLELHASMKKLVIKDIDNKYLELTKPVTKDTDKVLPEGWNCVEKDGLWLVVNVSNFPQSDWHPTKQEAINSSVE